jgi:hypothetical protein
LHTCEVRAHVQPLLQLSGHQLLSVADSDNLAAGNKDNLLRMLISYFAASDYRHF